MSRVPQIEREQLNDEGQRLYDEIVSARGNIAGPFRVWLHSPEFTRHATRLGEFLRYRTSLPPCLTELVILVAANATNCQVIRDIHAPIARDAGLSEDTIANIDAGRPLENDDPVEEAVRDFCMQLHRNRTADAAIVDRVVELLGASAAVEVTALCGYYTMVAMTLNAFDVR